MDGLREYCAEWTKTEKDKFPMCNLQNRINKQEKQAHIYREHFDDCQMQSEGMGKGGGD